MLKTDVMTNIKEKNILVLPENSTDISHFESLLEGAGYNSIVIHDDESSFKYLKNSNESLANIVIADCFASNLSDLDFYSKFKKKGLHQN